MGEGAAGSRAPRCEACGAGLPGRGDFCPRCGSPAADFTGLRCPVCSAPHPETAAFCSQCGAHLGSIARAERRVITVLFADLSGFTRLTEQLDPETVHALVVDCLEPLTECVTRWGGYVDKFIGDCVMALFGAPTAYENEPERAVRAALDMQEALRSWTPEARLAEALTAGDRPGLRIGVNTGSVVTGIFTGGGARDYTAVGDVVNVASRLQSLCEPGEILVGEQTYRETRHVVVYGEEEVLSLKGREEPVRARRVLRLRRRRRPLRGFRGEDAPLVDRHDELARLRAAWSEVSDGEARVLLVTGAPGVGKSRLVEELASAEELDAPRVATGRSYPYATRTPWGPVTELLRSLYRLPARLDPSRAAATLARRSEASWDRGEVEALSVALGGESAGPGEADEASPAERRDAVARAVTRALGSASAVPGVLVLEDLQWADATTLEYLAGLRPSLLPGPVLLLLVARPSLPDETGLARLLEAPLERIELGPLSDEESHELLEGLLGEHRLPDALLATMVERAEGNPLFLEEMLKSLAERGDLRQEDGRWEVGGDLDGLEVPYGVESLLSTRIDALATPTKRVLQYAAVVGRRFWSGLLADELVGRSVGDELDRLREGAMVRTMADSRVPGDREYAFEHLLLREVAYDGVLESMRTELHGAVARWLERRSGEGGFEDHDLVAHHWERSGEPARAVPHLERAARRARRRGALEDARAAVDRALELAGDPDVRVRLLGLAEDLAADAGDPARRAELVEALERLEGPVEASEEPGEAGEGEVEAGQGRALGEARAEAAFRRARLRLDEGRLQEARDQAERALEAFGRLGDVSRQGDTLSLLGRVAHLWGDYPEARRRYEASLPLQREAGDRYGEAEILDRSGLVQLDVGRYEEAVATFEEVRTLCAEIGARGLEARSVAHRATALDALGAREEAEAAAREALELARRSGSRRARAGAELTLATVLGPGAAGEAADLLDRVEAFAEETGRSATAARAYLVRAERARDEEALAWAERAREAAAQSGLVHVEILALTREAEVHLEAGNAAEADRLSGRASEMLRRHGNVQGPEERVHWIRARALRVTGRSEEAEEAEAAARTAVEEKAAWIRHDERRRRFLTELPLNAAVLSGEGGSGDAGGEGLRAGEPTTGDGAS